MSSLPFFPFQAGAVCIGSHPHNPVGKNPVPSVVDVTFDKPFKSVPASLCVFLSKFDCQRANVRLKVETEGLTTTGFKIRAFTWEDDSIAWGITVAWFASND